MMWVTFGEQAFPTQHTNGGCDTEKTTATEATTTMRTIRCTPVVHPEFPQGACKHMWQFKRNKSEPNLIISTHPFNL